MAKDISDKIGEMEHVIDSTTGMLADLDAKNGVDDTTSQELIVSLISAPKVGEYVQFQEILKVPVNGNEASPKSLDDFWGE